MTDTYKGESLGKKVARLTYWWAMSSARHDDFFQKKHIVLASREGGDVAVLKGLGVPSSNIVAVDRDESAARACAAKHPDVIVVHGDITEAAHKYRSAESITLDFCGVVSDETMAVANRAILRSLKDCSFFGLCFQRGRERGLDITRRRALDLSKRWRANRGKDWKKDDADLSRSVAAVARLIELGQSYNIAPHGILYINYHSRTRAGAGVPMTMVLGAVRKFSSPAEFDVGAPAFHRALDPMTRVSDLTFMSDRQLKTEAVRLAMDCGSSRPASLLNISVGEFAAWKAHATRGTYAKGAA